MAIEIGHVIEGRYKLRAQLGSGGFATVYQAEQLRTGQLVALKVLHDDLHTARAERIRARFSREMAVVARLHHPHIVPLIDTGELENGEAYTVFEFVDGPTLAQQLQRSGALQPTLVKRLMGQVLDALSCAHERGVVHRDLKPENVMLATTGARENAMVCDFGIASLTRVEREEDVQRLTAEGDIAGTPGYMAPEQIHGHTVTARTDLYAWGLMCYEVITGLPAVEGDTAMSVLLRQSNDEPIDLSRIEDAALRAIIARAIAKDPEERYPSADALLDDFEAWTPHDATQSAALAMSETVDGALPSETPPNLVDPDAGTADGPLMMPDPDLESPGDDDDEAFEPTPPLEPPPPPRPQQPSRHPAVWAIGGLTLGLLIMLIAWPSREETTPPRALEESSKTDREPPVEETAPASTSPSATRDADAVAAAPEPVDAASAPEVAEVTCAEGMHSDPPGAPCCWEGQSWSTEYDACVGQPECPEFHNPTPEGCALYNPKAWEAREACVEGDSESCYHLSTMYALGKGDVMPSTERANTYLDRACEMGHTKACLERANIYLDRPGSPEFDVEAGTALLEPLCEKGNTHACSRLGTVWGRADQDFQDPQRGLGYYFQGCMQENRYNCHNAISLLEEHPDAATSAMNLPVLHSYTCKTFDDSVSCHAVAVQALKGGEPERGRKLLKLACEKNYGPSCRELAPIIEVEGDLEHARKLWDRACVRISRETRSCIKAAELLSQELPDAPPDYARAIRLYRLACSYHNPTGCERARALEGRFGIAPDEEPEGRINP